MECVSQFKYLGSIVSTDSGILGMKLVRELLRLVERMVL